MGAINITGEDMGLFTSKVGKLADQIVEIAVECNWIMALEKETQHFDIGRQLMNDLKPKQDTMLSELKGNGPEFIEKWRALALQKLHATTIADTWSCGVRCASSFGVTLNKNKETINEIVRGPGIALYEIIIKKFNSE